MKICTTFHKKVPVPGLDYASQGFHLSIEAEPPREIQEDRTKLAEYTRRLFAECRSRVEEEIAEGQAAPATVPPDARAPARRRQFTPHRGSRLAGSRNGLATNGPASNGRASPKQVNFCRSLASQSGMSYEELAALAAEYFGKSDLRFLSKAEASQLIDELRGPGEE